MTLPAEGPGAPLESPGNWRPRGMVTLDRIRLTGLLTKSPACGAFLLLVVAPVPVVLDLRQAEQRLRRSALLRAADVHAERAQRRVADQWSEIVGCDLRQVREQELPQ